MTIDNEFVWWLAKKASLNPFSQYKGSRNKFQPRDVSKSLSLGKGVIFICIWRYRNQIIRIMSHFCENKHENDTDVVRPAMQLFSQSLHKLCAFPRSYDFDPSDPELTRVCLDREALHRDVSVNGGLQQGALT